MTTQFTRLPMRLLLALILSSIQVKALAQTCQHEMPATEAYKEAVFFYPCELSAPTPATTLTAGYNNTYRNLQWMAEAMADAGYVVLAMSPIDIYGDVPQWTAAHLGGQKTLIAENNRIDSPLKGKIDIERRGIAGFSMGGGGTLLAGSELQNDVKALAAFAPFLKAEDRLKVNVAVPTMILAGDRDLLVTNESIEEIYGRVTSAGVDNALAVYRNGRHQQWYRAEITTNRESYKAMAIAWFDLYLKGDKSAAKSLETIREDVGTNEELLSRYELNIQQ